MSFYESKAMLVDALSRDPENFNLSNLILPKPKSLKAVFMLYRLRDDLLKAAHDPKAAPTVPPMPEPPNIEGMGEEQASIKLEEYEKIKGWWLVMKYAHDLKVAPKDYSIIMDFLEPYFRTIYTTPSIKGNRFYSFTKNAERMPAGGGGFMQKLKGGSRDE